MASLLTVAQDPRGFCHIKFCISDLQLSDTDAQAFKAELSQHCLQPTIVIDFSGVRIAETTVWGCLIAFAKLFHGTLVLCNINADRLPGFRSMQLHRFNGWRVFRTLEEAADELSALHV